MRQLGKLTVATLGAGYAAQLHGAAYEQVYGADIRLKTIVDPILERAENVKEAYGYEQTSSDAQSAFDDPDIDVIDICTPPMLHKEQIIAALKAGKHVICEKPLIGYFGQSGDEEPIGQKVPKLKMYQQVLADIEEIRQSVKESGKQFCYAENFVYAASVVRAAELIRKKKTKLLFLKGEESLKGTVSMAGGEWKHIGGGALIRAGVHPLSAILMLKQAEASARGEEIHVVSVNAEMGTASKCLAEEEHGYIACRPNDVEDFASLSLMFNDGTTAQINTSDLLLGCPRGSITAYGHDAVLHCQVCPANPLSTLYLDEENFEDETLDKITSTKLGWSEPAVAASLLRGFQGEIQDFAESILTGKEPLSGFDIAAETIKLVYAAYLSAEEGKRVTV